LAPPVSFVHANLTADTVGVYVQDEYRLFHDLLLNAGARYDYFSSFGDTLNPRAAIIYKPWTDSTFKAIYGRAFRAPNAYEMYFEAPGYSSNQQLQSETIQSYELVYEQKLTAGARMTASLFYNDIHNLIDSGTNGSGAYVFGNLSDATSRGGELEFDGRWAKGWHARLGYTYADARDAATGQRLSNSPEHVAKLNLTAPLWREQVFLNVEVLGLSARQTVQSAEVGGYSLVNVTLFSREIIKGLEASAGIYNLFDQHYSDPVSSEFQQAAIRQDGRTFRLKLTYRF